MKAFYVPVQRTVYKLFNLHNISMNQMLLKSREVKLHAWGHPAIKWQSWIQSQAVQLQVCTLNLYIRLTTPTGTDLPREYKERFKEYM